MLGGLSRAYRSSEPMKLILHLSFGVSEFNSGKSWTTITAGSLGAFSSKLG